MKNLFSLLLLSTILISCSNSSKESLVLRESTGRINHLLIVIKNQNWNNEIGNAIRTIMTKPVKGLPQDENQFSVTQVEPKGFSSIFNNSRNILFVGLGKKDIFKIKYNIYASPQTTITILGKSKQDLINLIKTHSKELISVYKTADLSSFQQKLTKKTWKIKRFKTLTNLGLSLKIPKDFLKVEDTGNFLWLRKEISRGTLNIIVYSLPIINNDDLKGNNIIKSQDSITKLYIPGQFKGTYMTTEKIFSPYKITLKLNGITSFETRGLWEVKGDFMGGPYLNYTLLDKAKNRMVTVEGFTYAPSINKRDYMFELEAILKTIHIK